MNITALKAFVSTAETGSFSATGRMLGKSQAAISKLIANLEVDLNGQLFDRSGRYPALTELGLAIYERCQFLIEQETAITQIANSVATDHELELKIGIDSSANSPELNAILASLINVFEHLVIDISEAPMPWLIEALNHGKLDLVLGPQLQQRIEGLQILTSYPISLVAVTERQHALVKLSKVDLKDLKLYPAFSFSQARPIIDAGFRTSLRHCYATNPAQLASLIAQTNGFGFIPKQLAPQLCEQFNLTELKLAANVSNLAWQYELLAVQAFQPKKAVKLLIELLEENN